MTDTRQRLFTDRERACAPGIGCGRPRTPGVEVPMTERDTSNRFLVYTVRPTVLRTDEGTTVDSAGRGDVTPMTAGGAGGSGAFVAIESVHAVVASS